MVVRCRPLNRQETEDRRVRVVDMDTRTNLISLKNPKDERETPKQFTFDKIYDWNCRQVDIFDYTATALIDEVIGGFNGTIFAYGQVRRRLCRRHCCGRAAQPRPLRQTVERLGC